MVSTLPSSPLPYEPGQFDDVKMSDDFHYQSSSGSISGPGMDTNFVTPSFEEGEVWALKIRTTLSSEPSNDIVVMELMDEEETDYIQKATIPANGGHDAEIIAIVDWDTADWDSGASSPDFRVNAIGSDNFNYFIDCIGIRLRKPDNTNDLGWHGGTTHNFDL